MKNPNGYGSVVKLSGKRRKPYGARVTIGWEINEETGKAKQLYDYIGYYKSRQKAMIALAEYNKDPYDIDARKVMFKDLYQLFISEKFPDENLNDRDKNNKKAYSMAFNHSSNIHDFLFVDIRKPHLQEVINNCKRGHSTKKKIKTLYNQMYRFAIENDLTDKNYSEFVTVPANTKKTSRKPFTAKEIKKLWDNLHNHDFVDTVLIMIYTGMRPGELILIENDDINIEERYMRGGIKTDAGRNRIIPINKKILPLIKNRMSDSKYLILNSKRGKMSYATYLNNRWNPLIRETFKMDHAPHNCRHTFSTLMDNAGANQLARRKIMGHASKDLTDRVYTHKNIEELIKAVDLI